MFNITTSIFYTSGVIQIISLSFILVSMFFVILLLRYVLHFCFREILNFSYPNFYKFLFGHQTDSFDNNSGEGKYIYFKINVILNINIYIYNIYNTLK